MLLSFFVPGIPAAQGSKRHVGRGVMVESSKALKPWRLDVTHLAQAAHRGPAIDQPVTVLLEFTFPRPKAHYRTGSHAAELRPDAPHRHAKKPDGDKLARAVFDSLTAAGVIRDDSRISDHVVRKRYGDRPGVYVALSAAELAVTHVTDNPIHVAA